MDFEFGQTAKSKAFFDRNPSFIRNFQLVKVLGDKCLDREMKPSNTFEDVVFSIGHNCRNDFFEVVFLAVHGHGWAANRLFRGLYERAVTLAYIVDRPEKAERFVRFAAIQNYRAMQACLKFITEEKFNKSASPGNSVSQIRERYEQVKRQFKNLVTWDIDFAKMVESVGGAYRILFLPGYTIPTLQIHPTIAWAWHTGGELKGSVAVDTAHFATATFILVLMSQNRSFTLGLDSEIDDCVKHSGYSSIIRAIPVEPVVT